MGFKVNIPKKNDYSRLQKVQWTYARVPCSDINELNENDPKYSLAQKLWIISKKCKHLTYSQKLERVAKEGD